MSGGSVAYHLRPNKAVDRQLFIDLLVRLQRRCPLHDYRYFGFGGPFLEDFRVVHSHLGITKLTSIESDAEVFKRQAFNLPLDGIERTNQTSGDFISEYASSEPAIFWLDYASPKQLRSQLQELWTLVSKMKRHDIIKITVNATPDAVAPAPKSETLVPVEVKRQQHLEKLKSRLGEFLDNAVTADQMTSRELSTALVGSVTYAAAKGLEGSGLDLMLLTAFRYQDGQHIMLTVSGILIEPSERDELVATCGLENWGLGVLSGKPVEISVPSLSTRERLRLDQLLPTASPLAVTTALGYLCADSAEESESALSSYAKFYRHYPYYSRFIP